MIYCPYLHNIDDSPEIIINNGEVGRYCGGCGRFYQTKELEEL
jgi:hypothetical protein